MTDADIVATLALAIKPKRRRVRKTARCFAHHSRLARSHGLCDGTLIGPVGQTHAAAA